MKSDQQSSRQAEPAQAASEESTRSRREIAGNLSYTSAPGVLKRALDGIIHAERPEKFTSDFMSTVLNITGGSSRFVPPILKRMGFLTSDGSPTDLYSRFRADSTRSVAAIEGLKKAFVEIFRRNEFAHKLDANRLKDLVVDITGLSKSDPVVGSIIGTFNAIRDFVDVNAPAAGEAPPRREPDADAAQPPTRSGTRHHRMDLVYNINIVLPESTNVQVFNAIFRSLKENLLDD